MDRCPVHVARVESEDSASPGNSHPHDLTEVEHDHDFDELVIVTGGRAIHHMHGRAFDVRVGDVYLLDRSDRHFFSQRQRLSLLNVMYDPARLGLPIDRLRQMPGFHALFVLEPLNRGRHRLQGKLYLPPAELRPIVEIVERIEREVLQRSPGYEAMAIAKVHELIISLARRYDGRTSRQAEALLRLGHVLGRMHQQFDQSLALGDLAREAHMSVSNFVRRFQKATGLPPMRYLSQIRLDEARRLLGASDLSVAQISQRCGYYDGNHLARAFRRQFGESPRQFRGGA